jgi:ubiquinone/menaquinone biosynthesis C-methylase UbiE
LPKIRPFEENAGRYEDWFSRHENAYLAEVRAIAQLMGPCRRGLEVGVGSGRFAGQLGIRFGVDPSLKMLSLSRGRGILSAAGTGEDLPFIDNCFDLALMVTTVCFLDNADSAFREAQRVLEPAGVFIIGMVDKNSPLGRSYLERSRKSVFYREAEFYSVDDIVAQMKRAGFSDFQFRQTLFGSPEETPPSEPVKAGYGEGSFVAIKAANETG